MSCAPRLSSTSSSSSCSRVKRWPPPHPLSHPLSRHTHAHQRLLSSGRSPHHHPRNSFILLPLYLPVHHRHHHHPRLVPTCTLAPVTCLSGPLTYRSLVCLLSGRRMHAVHTYKQKTTGRPETGRKTSARRMSGRPACYATGRPLLLTQERLSRRRERESTRLRKLDHDNEYFAAWNAQSERLDHWDEQSVKSRGQKVHVSLPPYDCDERAFRSKEKSVPTAKVQTVTKDLRDLVQTLNELEEHAVQTKENSMKIISNITAIRNKRQSVSEVMQSIDSKHRKVVTVRSARDRLVHHLFLVMEKLQVIESYVKQCFVLIDSRVYCPEEQQDLITVLKSTENILRVMLSLNHTRHQDIASMFTEEAHRHYDRLMEEWDEEDQMIHQVTEKVFETIDSTLLQKLEANAELEDELLQTRKSKVEDLLALTYSLQNDQSLRNVLDASVFRTTVQSTGG